MAQKWNLQDIVPPERSPRRASASSRGTPRTSSLQRPAMRAVSTPPVYEEPTSFHTTSQQTPPPPSHYEPIDPGIARIEITDGRLSRLRRYIFGGVFLVTLGLIGFTTTILLTGAEVSITPKIHKTTVQATYTAKNKPTVGELGYEILTLEESAEKQVAAKGEEQVSLKATGKLRVSNGFSNTPQRFVKNTRFASPSGLIYRAVDEVVIPGYKKDTNGTIIPGTVIISVLAEGAGESYNLASGRLTVPGLKGSEQFDKIYAEVEKEGITGGFEGKKMVVDETELATKKQQMQTELRDKLLARIETERPNGFVLYKDAITFSFDSLPPSGNTENIATLKERAMLHVPLFNEIAFASFLAKETVPSYKGEAVRLENPQTLSFKYEQPPLEDISTKDSLTFTLSGSAMIIWGFDAEKLKKDLASKSESDLLTVLKSYPSIDKAQAVIRPVWKNSFPSNLEEIRITEVLPNN